MHELDTRWDPAAASARGVVLMLHGGAERGRHEVGPHSTALGRTRWMANTIRARLAREGYAVAVLRFSVRGWNADQTSEPSPLPDGRWALDQIRERFGTVPVVLLGHSMGARTAWHLAGDPQVVGVVGLAPWFPADEDITPVAGVSVVAAHGSRDRITSARQTRTLLDRAAGTASSTTFIDMGPIGHYMLTNIRQWNRVAVHECLKILEGS